MKPSLKLTLLASTIIGLAIASASSTQAQYYGRDDRSRAISSSPETGGYCDNAGCPDRFWKYPIHYGPVYFHGQWYRGPVYFHADRHGRQYWVSGGWHRDEWRGRRPAWARQSHDGPALDIEYYASHGFRVGDRGRQSYNADTRGGDVVSFQSFHRTLSAHGDWVYSDRWGEVWVPADVPNDFHPYYSGWPLGQHARIWLALGIKLRLGRHSFPLRTLGERPRRRVDVDSGLCLEFPAGSFGVQTITIRAGCQCRPMKAF